MAGTLSCELAFFPRYLPKWPVFHRIRVLKWRQGPGELRVWGSVGGLERTASDGTRTGGSRKRTWIWAPWSSLGQRSDLQDWGRICWECFAWRENDGRESWRPGELNRLHSLAAKERYKNKTYLISYCSKRTECQLYPRANLKALCWISVVILRFTCRWRDSVL